MTQVANPPDVIDAKPSELARIIDGSGLTRDIVKPLQEAFQPFFDEVATIVGESRGIVVTDATQVTEIKQARAARLKLAAVRVASEKSRVKLKAGYLVVGQTIDKMNKVIESIAVTEESRLLDMEKFAERKEAERQATLKAIREDELRPFGIDTQHYALGTMPEDQYQSLLEGTKRAAEARAEEARKAEAARVEAERVRLEEQARIKAENDRLKAEAEAKDAELRAQREAQEAERKKVEVERLEAERKAQAEARAIREKAEETARVLREAEAAERRRIQEEADKKAAEASEVAAAEFRRRDAERFAAEAKAREERQAAEAKASEELRLAAEKLAKAEKRRKATEAAAADLLAACKQAEVMLRGALQIVPEKDVMQAVLTQVQAAIARAENA